MRTVQYKIQDYRKKKISDYQFMETKDTLRKCAEKLGFDVSTEKQGQYGVKYFYNKKDDTELTIYYA